MEIVILPDPLAVGSAAADMVGDLLQRRPEAMLGLATGSSPLPTYDHLAPRCAQGRVSFEGARGFTLDEYVGLPADHPASYRRVIHDDLVDRVDFVPGAVQAPRGDSSDIAAACVAYEADIASQGALTC